VLSNANYATRIMSLTGDQVQGITGKPGPAGKETAGPEGFVVEKIDPNTGKAVRVHAESGIDTADYIDASRLKTGPEIGPNDMLNAVIAKNPVLGDRILEAVTYAKREKEETVQARSLSQALSSIISNSGKLVTFTDTAGKGTLTVGTPGQGLLGTGANAQASVHFARRNAEEHNYDLYYGMVGRIQEKAREKATRPDGMLDSAMYSKLYAQALHDLWKATDEVAHGKTEFSFGADSFLGEPWEDAKAYMRKVRGGSQTESHQIYRGKIPERP